jgi:hypothetical protein
MFTKFAYCCCGRAAYNYSTYMYTGSELETFLPCLLITVSELHTIIIYSGRKQRQFCYTVCKAKLNCRPTNEFFQFLDRRILLYSTAGWTLILIMHWIRPFWFEKKFRILVPILTLYYFHRFLNLGRDITPCLEGKSLCGRGGRSTHTVYTCLALCCYDYLENIGYVYPAMSMIIIGLSRTPILDKVGAVCCMMFIDMHRWRWYAGLLEWVLHVQREQRYQNTWNTIQDQNWIFSFEQRIKNKSRTMNKWDQAWTK